MLGLIILGIILLILLIVIVSNVKVVPQAHAYVIERLGTYHVTWATGLHVKIPFIDKISKKVSLKEQVIDFPPRMEWIKRYLLLNLKKRVYIRRITIINNNYLFNIFNIWAIGLFFYALLTVWSTKVWNQNSIEKNERVAHCGYFDISEMYKPVHLIWSDRHILSSTQNNVRGLILNPYFDMMPWSMFCFLCYSFVLLKWIFTENSL